MRLLYICVPFCLRRGDLCRGDLCRGDLRCGDLRRGDLRCGDLRRIDLRLEEVIGTAWRVFFRTRTLLRTPRFFSFVCKRRGLFVWPPRIPPPPPPPPPFCGLYAGLGLATGCKSQIRIEYPLPSQASSKILVPFKSCLPHSPSFFLFSPACCIISNCCCTATPLGSVAYCFSNASRTGTMFPDLNAEHSLRS